MNFVTCVADEVFRIDEVSHVTNTRLWYHFNILLSNPTPKKRHIGLCVRQSKEMNQMNSVEMLSKKIGFPPLLRTAFEPKYQVTFKFIEDPKLIQSKTY